MNKNLLDKPLDDEEMRNYLECNNCIMTYAELNDVKHLNELLPTDKSFKGKRKLKEIEAARKRIERNKKSIDK
jgi:hypothetical protein